MNQYNEDCTIVLNDKVVANIGKKLPIDSFLIDDWQIIDKHRYKHNRITKGSYNILARM